MADFYDYIHNGEGPGGLDDEGLEDETDIANDDDGEQKAKHCV